MRILISAFLILGVAACSDLHIYTEHDDLEAARTDGAMERGWLPEWMPERAILIHEYHDLDTSAQAISFQIEGNAKFEWPAMCTRAVQPTPPRLKTKLFPKSVHKLKGVKNCRDYFVAQDAARRGEH